MVLKVAMIISTISIILLIIYGADSIMAITEHLGMQNTAFLQMDVKARGLIFGMIPAILLIISFFITRKEPSKILGILIIIGGALMVVGVGLIFALQGSSIPTAGQGEFGAVVGIGVVIMALGGLKIKKSKIKQM
jgi:peptidoglycan/LPS O-acetylase OafA/YrhL